MQLWIHWWSIAKQFRNSFTRDQTFLWFLLVLIGFLTRNNDLVGVSSTIRTLGLNDFYYDRILDFFHSSAIKIDLLALQWTKIALKTNLAYRLNGRLILVGDGLKASKEGKKMPGVKSLHQASESNSKPEYIMGHSFQALSLLTSKSSYYFAVPLIARIHEGIVKSNRDKRTQMDKMIAMHNCLQIEEPHYFLADAYYSNRKIILGLLENGHHLISRVRNNSVAYLLPENRSDDKAGRPKTYGKQIKLRTVFSGKDKMSSAVVGLYNEKPTEILYRCLDLLWKPVGISVRFVFVIHPNKGKVILMSSDLNLDPLAIIHTYSLRFKIEVSFKQAVNTIGSFAYHFWMKLMTKIKRKSGDQYLHKKTKDYRDQVDRKIAAYHAHVQIGLIAQGILQIISMTVPDLVWKNFGSWIRTIRPGILPSEQITMSAMQNTLPAFLRGSTTELNLEKFILEKVDLGRSEGLRMIA